MFSVLKSKRIVFQNKTGSPVLFVCFLNDQRAFVLFQNSSFCLLQTNQDDSGRVLFEDTLNQPIQIVDCKRIKTNVCVILSRSLESLTLVKYVSDEEVMVGGIVIAEMSFFKGLMVSSSLISFHDKLFVVKSESFEQRICYFTIFREDEKVEFNYSEISIISCEFDPVSSKEEIFKVLALSQQLAFFKQNQEEQVDWKVKLISLRKGKNNKEIDLAGVLSSQQLVVDIVALENEQYLLFVDLLQSSQDRELKVFSVKFYEAHSQYVQNTSLLYSFKTAGRLLTEIIDVNYKQGFFLTKTLGHVKINQQISDNFLELRKLQTGQLVYDLPCCLKTLDFNPTKTKIIDYSQEIDFKGHVVIHVRGVFSKKCIYYFLLRKRGSLKKTEISNLLPLVLTLL